MQHSDAPTLEREQHRFDFWLGTWDLRWTTPEGHPRGGTNVITRALGDAVILETFSDPVGSDGTGYDGLSVSTYDESAGLWRQTWVDSGSSHMSFAGGWADDRMQLQRTAVVDGAEVVQRMTWRDITPEAFGWDWERSRDDGATWELLWRIDYRRVSTG